ncbi:solute carrier family 35 member F2 isoform X2 [Austrofundulus limnaeus]|uniref:Solute carrier family 35 member F2 isoform X2 n=1 Tax=Austrofundulus limnaeus TaxID=52670 RepID=A0A2I4BUH3_AUSLI|nr:PREDICTED: solute carrier family 35 member F2-like isoform X2 [Austrofundulus limnaeus]
MSGWATFGLWFRIRERDTSFEEHSCGFLTRIRKFNPKDVFTWQLAKTLAMGQCLAALICGTAVSSQYLASDFQVNTPMLQSLLNYMLLCVTYTTMLLCRKGDGNILQILRRRWWKYLLLGLVDVEANYTVVKAYQYTTLTSVQLLDCFVIPVLMVLSWWFLKTRYRVVHYVSVCVCLLGVGAMVGADLLAGRDQGSTSNILLGDGLVMLSATLYAVSNVSQEYTVKNLSRVEFLGMVGLFGTIISAVQMVILERSEVSNIKWSWQVGLLFAAFALCMFALYSGMPVVMKLSSATSVNLSLLTSDLFSLFVGIFLFHYNRKVAMTTLWPLTATSLEVKSLLESQLRPKGRKTKRSFIKTGGRKRRGRRALHGHRSELMMMLLSIALNCKLQQHLLLK